MAAQDELIRRLFGQGLTDYQIGQRAGIGSSVVAKRRLALGLHRDRGIHHSRPRRSLQSLRQLEQKAYQQRCDGASWVAIAVKQGVSVEAVRHRAQRHADRACLPWPVPEPDARADALAVRVDT